MFIYNLILISSLKTSGTEISVSSKPLLVFNACVAELFSNFFFQSF